jgi:hypothetical protein
MKVKLIFDDWKFEGRSVYNTETGVELTSRDFHSGTTFDGKIHLDREQEVELHIALMAGYTPSFIMMEE